MFVISIFMTMLNHFLNTITWNYIINKFPYDFPYNFLDHINVKLLYILNVKFIDIYNHIIGKNALYLEHKF